MKKIIALSLTVLTLSFNSFAQTSCYDAYLSETNDPIIAGWVDNLHNRSYTDAPDIVDISLYTVGATGAVGTVVALTGASAGILLIPAGIAFGVTGLYDGVVALTNIKEKKMMKLIADARNYIKHGGKNSPGKQLSKLHSKIKNENTTIYELARHIYDADRDGSLCAGSMTSFRKLSRDIKKGVVVIEGSDI